MAKYLSAEALGIKDWEHEKLIETLALLESQTVTKFRYGKNQNGLTFDMAVCGRTRYDRKDHQCGTTACIGGWMFYLHHAGLIEDGLYPSNIADLSYNYVMKEHSDSLHDLFFPSYSITFDSRLAYSDISTEEAVTAIEHFLETGLIDWSHVH